jgi:hypothetical protein
VCIFKSLICQTFEENLAVEKPTGFDRNLNPKALKRT